MGLTFFGLTFNTAPSYRVGLFSQIHEIVFHGKGGYTFDAVYNMPIWLRKFTFNKIKKYYDEEKEAIQNSSNNNSNNVVDPSGKVNKDLFKQTSPFKVKAGPKKV